MQKNLILTSVIAVFLSACAKQAASTPRPSAQGTASTPTAASPAPTPEGSLALEPPSIAQIAEPAKGGDLEPGELPSTQWPSEVRGDPAIFRCKRLQEGGNGSATGTPELADVYCESRSGRFTFYPQGCSAAGGRYGQVKQPGGGRVVITQHEDANSKSRPLPAGQLLCETAVVRNHDLTLMHYVHPINPADVPACAANRSGACSSVKVKLPSTCKPDTQGLLGPNCPGGWINEREYVELRMGGNP